MTNHTSEQINQLTQSAKNEENDTKAATASVHHAISHMNPQRQYNKDVSQNKR